jgi:arylsulfatase
LDPLADDYLQPDMEPKQTRDGYPVRTGKGVMAGAADTYIAYGQGWATVSNTPFREYKHWVHEGGISTPLIAHWPARITRAGELESTPSHLIDLMATAVDLAEAEYPTTFHDGQPIQPMEGVSLRPLFLGESIEREALYWEHEGNRAVRVDNLKLVAKGVEGEWELYDISQDRSEQHNLAAERPEKVAQMADMFQAFAERANVLPLVPYRKKKNESFKTNQLKFKLEQNDNLDRHTGPYVVDRGIIFSAHLSDAVDGVLVAQGGVTHGWAVYLEDGKLCIATTNSGARTIISSAEPISGAGQVKTVIQRNGKVRINWNGQQVGEGQLDSLLSEQPADGLQVGSDDQGNVGDYETPNTFDAEISEVTILLRK